MRSIRAYKNNNKLLPARAVAISAAVLLSLLALLLARNVAAVDFALLPAIKSELAEQGLLLDAASNGNRLLVAGEQGYILFSDDGGATWSNSDVPVSLAITGVAFAGDNHAWATAHDGFLLHSTDNGQSWQTKLTGSNVAELSVGALEERVEAIRADLAEATDETREDLEWALEDGLFAIEEAKEAIDTGMTTPLLDVWFYDADNGFALGAYGVFLRTRDGGVTWVVDSNRLDNLDKYHLYGITRSKAGTLLVAGEAGTVLRSLDDGMTWERIETSYSGSFFGTVAARDGGLLVFGLRGNVFRSADEGETWSAVDTGDERTLMSGTIRDDGILVLAGSAGALLVSEDDGASFDSIPTEGSRVYSGTTTTRNGNIVLVGFGGISVYE
ncbi:MAG: YCF48-related protein [Woeseiaceae bacterium]|nr:YCF48-related protein [Woeseiaceae bacterium]